MTAFFIMTNYLAYSIIFFTLLRVLNLQEFADYLKHLGFNKLSSTVKNTLDSIEDSNNKEKRDPCVVVLSREMSPGFAVVC